MCLSFGLLGTREHGVKMLTVEDLKLFLDAIQLNSLYRYVTMPLTSPLQ